MQVDIPRVYLCTLGDDGCSLSWALSCIRRRSSLAASPEQY